jgi:hypothetical protein
VSRAGAVAQALLVAVLLFAMLGAGVDRDVFRALFSESGPFERGALLLWALLATLCVMQAREHIGSPRRYLLLCAVLAGLFALREADAQYIYGGGNLLKLGFYLEHPAPLLGKLVAGTLAIVAMATLLTTVWVMPQLLSPHLRHWDWARLILVGIAAALTSKLLDRSLNLLREEAHLEVSRAVGQAVGAAEEGLEFLLPAVFAFALWRYRSAQRARVGVGLSRVQA